VLGVDYQQAARGPELRHSGHDHSLGEETPQRLRIVALDPGTHGRPVGKTEHDIHPRGRDGIQSPGYARCAWRRSLVAQELDLLRVGRGKHQRLR
jgi:hypothetical protein